MEVALETIIFTARCWRRMVGREQEMSARRKFEVMQTTNTFNYRITYNVINKRHKLQYRTSFCALHVINMIAKFHRGAN